VPLTGHRSRFLRWGAAPWGASPATGRPAASAKSPAAAAAAVAAAVKHIGSAAATTLGRCLSSDYKDAHKKASQCRQEQLRSTEECTSGPTSKAAEDDVTLPIPGCSKGIPTSGYPECRLISVVSIRAAALTRHWALHQLSRKQVVQQSS
jgi:hypothetical protein